MKTIKLTQGKYAIVDDADYEWLSASKWCFNMGYAYRRKKTVPTYMHREIMSPPPGMQVDHINGDGLDNRRANLRICTQTQNLRNNRRRRAKSGFKGVYPGGKPGRWCARICVDKQPRHLGTYDCPRVAAKVYDEAAIRFFGEFATINGMVE